MELADYGFCVDSPLICLIKEIGWIADRERGPPFVLEPGGGGHGQTLGGGPHG